MSGRKRNWKDAEAKGPQAEDLGIVDEKDIIDEASLQHMTQLTQQCEQDLAEASEVLQAMAQEEKDVLVAEMIRHVIFKNHAKNGLPISHAELIEVVNKKYTGSAKKGLSRHIIRLAQSKILQIFGMELREVHRPVASAKGTSNKSAAGERGTAWYSLRSTLPANLRQRLVQVPLGKEDFNGFAMTILSIMEISGAGGIVEDELWRVLNSLGLDAKANHPLFGQPSELLKKMESMRYIIKEKAVGSESFKYRMGENAADEVGKDKIRAHIREIMGDLDED